MDTLRNNNVVNPYLQIFNTFRNSTHSLFNSFNSFIIITAAAAAATATTTTTTFSSNSCSSVNTKSWVNNKPTSTFTLQIYATAEQILPR